MKYIRTHINEDFIKGYDDSDFEEDEYPLDDMLQSQHKEFIYDDLLEMINKDQIDVEKYFGQHGKYTTLEGFLPTDFGKYIPEAFAYVTLNKNDFARVVTLPTTISSYLQTIGNILDKHILKLKTIISIIKADSNAKIEFYSLPFDHIRMIIKSADFGDHDFLCVVYSTSYLKSLIKAHTHDTNSILNDDIINYIHDTYKDGKDVLDNTEHNILYLKNLDIVSLCKLLKFIIVTWGFNGYIQLYMKNVSEGILECMRKHAKLVIDDAIKFSLFNNSISKQIKDISGEKEYKDTLDFCKKVFYDLSNYRMNNYYCSETYKTVDEFISKLYNVNEVFLKYSKYLNEQIKLIEKQ